MMVILVFLETKKHPNGCRVSSASRTRTYDIMINSHALLPTELWRNEI